MEPYTEKENVILKRCIIFHYIDGLIFLTFLYWEIFTLFSFFNSYKQCYIEYLCIELMVEKIHKVNSGKWNPTTNVCIFWLTGMAKLNSLKVVTIYIHCVCFFIHLHTQYTIKSFYIFQSISKNIFNHSLNLFFLLVKASIFSCVWKTSAFPLLRNVLVFCPFFSWIVDNFLINWI